MFTYLQTFNAYKIIDIIFSVLLLVFILFYLKKLKISKLVIGIICASLAVIICSVLLDLSLLKILSCITLFLMVGYAGVIMSNREKENLLRAHKKVSSKKTALSTNEKDELVSKLYSAVKMLSSTQTGALITIEQNDDLSDLMLKNGSKVEAPVSPELIETIFYKGTPLHDGATIIRGNMIICSAVFYQPTQRPLTGKFGSRHRAALGISEICDALTIVVSEETGKVSFTYKGELVPVAVSNFEEELKTYLKK